MATGYQIDEVTGLRLKLAEAEAELDYRKRKQTSADQRFRELLDATPIMVWMSGTDAMGTFFNRAWLEFRGRTREEELGHGWAEGLHPDDRDLCLETYLKAFAARTPFRVQYRVQRAGGAYAWIENSGTPLIEDTVFVGFMGTAMDISERRSRMYTPDRESVRLVFALRQRHPPASGREATAPAIRITAGSGRTGECMNPRAGWGPPPAPGLTKLSPPHAQ